MAVVFMFLAVALFNTFGPTVAEGETRREREKFEDDVAKGKYMCCRCGATEIALTPDFEHLGYDEKDDMRFETVSWSDDDTV
jgi:hypothetical protein